MLLRQRVVDEDVAAIDREAKFRDGLAQVALWAFAEPSGPLCAEKRRLPLTPPQCLCGRCNVFGIVGIRPLYRRPPPSLGSRRMAEKRYLLTPGPTPVPPEVLAALAEPVVHHRARDYRQIYERCLGRLSEVYRTQNDVLMFTTSGTGAFESAVANLTSPGDRQLVLSAGNFGERWAGMVQAFGAELVHVRLDWGRRPGPDDLRSALAGGDIRVVYLTHSETSTGVVCDVQALASVAREAGALR